MGILSKILGGAATQPIEAVGNVLTGVFGSKGQKLSHEQIMAKLAMSPQMAQLEINKVEAGHRSIFVAGWRPAIGWVCVLGLFLNFVANPVIVWFGGTAITAGLSALMPLVISLLGLGGYRTVEKIRGKAS